MTFEQYQIEAMRTFKDLGSIEKNRLHMECGMLTEAGELVDQIKKHFAYGKDLDVVNLQEEWGDFMWYYANYLTISRINFMPENTRKQKESRIHGLVKKLMKEKRFTEMEAVANLITDNASYPFGYVPFIGHLIGDPEKMLQMNIDKLRKRYPEKFDSDLAINRDTDAERVILEQHKH